MNIFILDDDPIKAAQLQCDKHVVIDNPIESYRNYYQTKQRRFKMSWTNRTAPEWFNANL